MGLEQARQRPDIWGRLVESAVCMELLARHLTHSNRHPQIHYWNNGQKEVDYVLTAGQDLLALEFKADKTSAMCRDWARLPASFQRPDRRLWARAGFRWPLGCRRCDRCVPRDERKRRGYRCSFTARSSATRHSMPPPENQAALSAGRTPRCCKALNSCCSCASLGWVAKPWAATVMARVSSPMQRSTRTHCPQVTA